MRLGEIRPELQQHDASTDRTSILHVGARSNRDASSKMARAQLYGLVCTAEGVAAGGKGPAGEPGPVTLVPLGYQEHNVRSPRLLTPETFFPPSPFNILSSVSSPGGVRCSLLTRLKCTNVHAKDARYQYNLVFALTNEIR